MAKYTTLVRTICEFYGNNNTTCNINNSDEVIKKSVGSIFSFFPIFSEEHREELCVKILKHYFLYEIGLETVALWKYQLNQKLNEIMPYYNELYKTLAMEFDVFEDVNISQTIKKEYTGDITGSFVSKKNTVSNNNNTNNSNHLTSSKNSGTETSDTNTESNNTQTTTNTNNSKDMFSDTPQNGLTSVESGQYLTNARIINGNNNTNNNETGKNTTENLNTFENNSTTTDETSNITTIISNSNEDGTTTNVNNETRSESETVINKGKSGGKSYMQLVKEYRENILNIDMMIIEDLKELFMLIF